MIVAPLPYNIQNGDPIDATPPMANFNQLRNNVNSNAADLGVQNTFSQPQNGVAAILPAQFTILSQVQALLNNLMPIGVIVDFGGNSVPAGGTWALCDGSTYLRSNTALFAAIGTLWGAGDGVSTANLPDFRRASSVGSGGAGTGTLGNSTGAAGGTESHSILVAELPAHNHTINDPGHAHSLYDPGHNHGVNDPGHAHSISDPGHSHSYTQPAGTTTTPGGGAFASQQPTGGTTGGSGTGIGIYGNTTGIYLSASGTGMGVYSATTGITTANTGSGTAMNLYHPVRVVTKMIRVA